MARSKRPTISDLAKQTGFSRSTISKAFSGSADVLPQTRTLILQVAEAIKYPARARLPSRSGPKTGRYGLILPSLDNPHYSELVQCLDFEARRSSKIILLGLHYGEGSVAESLVRHWFSGLTDGVIIDPPGAEMPHTIDLVRSRNLPVVFLHARPSADFFVVHHSRGSSYRRALRQLLDLGHRRIAYVGVEAPSSRVTESFVEYKHAIEDESGQKLHEEYLYFGRNDASTGFDAFGKFLRAKKRPTAVVCFNDILACGVCHAVRVQRMRIPDDVSVVGGDNIREAARLGLTTVHADRALMAREVYRLLQLQEAEAERPAEDVSIPTELIVRESVSFPPRE